MVRPNHFAVCNAVGAALCSISASIDVMIDLLPSSVDGGQQREKELKRLTLKVQEQCEQNGARANSIELVELEQIPLAYQPGGHKHRVQLTAIGQLDLNKFQRNQSVTYEKKSRLHIEKEAPADIKPPIHVEMTKNQPIFDENGVWCVDAIDIEYIAYGTGILGCGGGGESYNCKQWCLQLLRNDKYQMRVIHPSFYASESHLFIPVGFMGAPTVSHELLSNGHECLEAVNAIENFLSKKATGIFSAEIGGSNGLMGLVIAALKGIFCVDCDGMGRAYPRLDQELSFIHNLPVTPACLCDTRGETVLCTADMISTATELEDVLRIECTKRGLQAALCLPPLTGEQVQKHTILHTLSLAWLLGEYWIFFCLFELENIVLR